MTAKPKKTTGAKDKKVSEVKSKAKAKKQTVSTTKSKVASKAKVKTAAKARGRSKGSVLGDDPLSWMKDALKKDSNKDSSEEIETSKISKDLSVSQQNQEKLEDQEKQENENGQQVPDKQTFEDRLKETLSSAESSEAVTEVVKEDALQKDEIDLGESLIISSIKEVKSLMDEAWGNNGGVVLNADRIDEVDTAGIQLLFAFKLELAKQKRNLDFSTIPGKLKDVAEIMGVSESLFETR